MSPFCDPLQHIDIILINCKFHSLDVVTVKILNDKDMGQNHRLNVVSIIIGTIALKFHNAMVRDLSTKHVQVDEVWSFVGSKDKNVQPKNWGKGMSGRLIIYHYQIPKRSPQNKYCLPNNINLVFYINLA